MTDELEAQRGRLAEDVLKNPVYAEAYTLIEQELTRQWRESKDRDDREEIHRALRMLLKVQNVLAATMSAGKVAAKELERKRNLAERIGLRRKDA